MQHFASDNYAGICPEALQALLAANTGHAAAYGDDEWTRQASERLRELFATDCDVYFVFNGTAANSLALASLCQSYHSVICHELAHVETDECGGPEFFSNGSKLLLAKGEDGKLTPETVREVISRRNDIHYPKPHVVTLTQATELGTLYRPAEIAAIADLAHHCGLRVHMDGARFANAVASLDVTPADLTWRAGVDVLCFGGTKMGLPMGEAVVFFDRALQAGRTTGLQDALPCGPLARNSGGRNMASTCQPRQRHGAATGHWSGFCSRRQPAISGRGQRRFRHVAAVGTGRVTCARLALLHFYRCWRRPLHVRLGYQAGKRRCATRRLARTLGTSLLNLIRLFHPINLLAVLQNNSYILYKTIVRKQKHHYN
jgi:hypothetical protein